MEGIMGRLVVVVLFILLFSSTVAFGEIDPLLLEPWQLSNGLWSQDGSFNGPRGTVPIKSGILITGKITGHKIINGKYVLDVMVANNIQEVIINNQTRFSPNAPYLKVGDEFNCSFINFINNGEFYCLGVDEARTMEILNFEITQKERFYEGMMMAQIDLALKLTPENNELIKRVKISDHITLEIFKGYPFHYRKYLQAR